MAAVLKSRKFDLCPTEQKCVDFKNAGPKACSRCPKNLGHVEEIENNKIREWIEVDDTNEIIFNQWIAYLIQLWKRAQFFRIDEAKLTADEAKGILMVQRAVENAERKIAEVKKAEAELADLGKNGSNNTRN